MTTIEAKRVYWPGLKLAGLLPAHWSTVGYERGQELGLADGRDWLDLTDPQTAFGCALKLDEWERARTPGWGQSKPWVSLVALSCRNPFDLLPGLARRPAERLTKISQDHAIRRALGWTVEPGTLAKLERLRAGGDWRLTSPCGGVHVFSAQPEALTSHPSTYTAALAGITDPTKARAAIYAELCT